MKRGNPYHDSKGRFTSPMGAYDASKDKCVSRTADSLTEYYQENYSEVEMEMDENTGAWEQSHIYEWDAFEDERREVYAEMESLTTDIYQEYNDKMNERFADMSAEDLQNYAKNPDPVHDVVRAEMLRSCGGDYSEFQEMAVESADEDFSSDVPDYKYRRAIIKTRSKKKLFALASTEDGTGYTDARDRIKEKGLSEEYAKWLEKNN